MAESKAADVEDGTDVIELESEFLYELASVWKFLLEHSSVVCAFGKSPEALFKENEETYWTFVRYSGGVDFGVPWVYARMEEDGFADAEADTDVEDVASEH